MTPTGSAVRVEGRAAVRRAGELACWWVLLFVSPRPPRRPSTPLGAAVVRGHDLLEALDEAWRLGINPGGTVLGTKIRRDQMPRLSPTDRNRLLSMPEADALALRLDGSRPEKRGEGRIRGA